MEKCHRITITFDRPDVDVSNKEELKACAEMVANDLTEQIMDHLVSMERTEYLDMWDKRLRRWNLERNIWEKKKETWRQNGQRT